MVAALVVGVASDVVVVAWVVVVDSVVEMGRSRVVVLDLWASSVAVAQPTTTRASNGKTTRVFMAHSTTARTVRFRDFLYPRSTVLDLTFPLHAPHGSELNTQG
ncbi:MAG: hypothetical protein M3N43_07415, partial [Actinomycetota bacterium]|nr:hypothetical protein [Actinomycetota bacterium]